MDSLLAEGAGLGGGDVPGLTDEEYERYRELLEIKCHLENGNPLARSSRRPATVPWMSTAMRVLRL